MEKNMVVMKFGGASLENGESILRVAQIINKYKDQKKVIVVSAMYKVTDSLIESFKLYEKGDVLSAMELINQIGEKHYEVLRMLNLNQEQEVDILRNINVLLSELLSYMGSSDFKKSDYDYVISFGERFSSIIVVASLLKLGLVAQAVNSSKVLIATSVFGNAKVIFKPTRKLAGKYFEKLFSESIIPVVTGFFASNKKGQIVTFGRGGSDYSATILASVLDAKEVILWKEVDGVYDCDPKKNPGAKFYNSLSYELALSLAKQGAKILHPEAMRPVASKSIVVSVKSFYKPEFSGTKIWKGGLE